MVFDNLLQHRVEVYVGDTVAESGTGGLVVSDATLRAASVPCLVNTASSTEALQWGQPGLLATHKIAFPEDAAGTERGDVYSWVWRAGKPAVILKVTGIQNVAGMGGITDFTYVYAAQVQ